MQNGHHKRVIQNAEAYLREKGSLRSNVDIAFIKSGM